MKVSQESCRRPWMVNCLQWYPDHLQNLDQHSMEWNFKTDKTQILFTQNVYLFAYTHYLFRIEICT
ncbi:AAEL012537-PA, partial [Aedes aegypti]